MLQSIPSAFLTVPNEKLSPDCLLVICLRQTYAARFETRFTWKKSSTDTDGNPTAIKIAGVVTTSIGSDPRKVMYKSWFVRSK